MRRHGNEVAHSLAHVLFAEDTIVGLVVCLLPWKLVLPVICLSNDSISFFEKKRSNKCALHFSFGRVSLNILF